MQPGAVRDRLLAFLQDWIGRLEAAVRDGQREGEISKKEDPGQFAFDLESSLLLANTQFTVAQNSEPIERARRAIDRRIKEAAA